MILMIISDIIPITFMGGTGGAMLTQLLIKAKNLDFSDIILSEHGHAHSNYQDFTICEFGVTNPDMHKIKHVLNSDVIGKYPPYFISLHLKDLELSKKYFNKIIRITYDNNDISDIFKNNAWKKSYKECKKTALRFFDYLAKCDTINTNRLHVAIAGSLLNRKVFLHDNSYYKNRAVYDYSLKKNPNVVFVKQQ